MEKGKFIKRGIIFIIALVILFSLSKNLNLQTNNNIVEQIKDNASLDKTEDIEEKKQAELKNNTVSEKTKNAKEEKEEKTLNTSKLEEKIFAEISSNHEDLPVLQEKKIKNDYYGYTINHISISKELGDFQNAYGVLEEIDKEGNTIGSYSYLIINMTVECYEEFPQLYLNSLYVFLYKGTEFLQECRAFTSNNTVPMSSKSSMRYDIKKGEVKNINVVYLVNDEYMEEGNTDIYLYINNGGASFGDNLENKRLVKLDTEEVFQ